MHSAEDDEDLVRNDQLYHYYLGAPIEVFLLHTNGEVERVIVGPDLRSGERVQLLIPGDTFHTARVIGRSHLSTEIKADEPIRCVLDTRAKRAALLHLLPAEAGTSRQRPRR